MVGTVSPYWNGNFYITDSMREEALHLRGVNNNTVRADLDIMPISHIQNLGSCLYSPKLTDEQERIRNQNQLLVYGIAHNVLSNEEPIDLSPRLFDNRDSIIPGDIFYDYILKYSASTAFRIFNRFSDNVYLDSFQREMGTAMGVAATVLATHENNAKAYTYPGMFNYLSMMGYTSQIRDFVELTFHHKTASELEEELQIA